MSYLRSRNGRMFAAVLLFGFLVPPIFAQNARLELKNLEKLSSKASEVADVSLDDSMLHMAASMTGKNNQAVDLLANLQGIYVKSFKFDRENQYSWSDVEAIHNQLQSPGWIKIVETREEKKHEISEIYMMKKNGAMAGLVILAAEPKELTVVNIVGRIDLEKLGALGGQFGVPPLKVEPGTSPPPTPSHPDLQGTQPKDNDSQNVSPGSASGGPSGAKANTKPAGKTSLPMPQ